MEKNVHKYYQGFKRKRMLVANNILNERECTSQTLRSFQMKEEDTHHKHYDREYKIIHMR